MFEAGHANAQRQQAEEDDEERKLANGHEAEREPGEDQGSRPAAMRH